MSFESLFNNISPRLKGIARWYKRTGCLFSEDDLYQEMCIYVWNNYKKGLPEDINEAYVIKGCKFHMLNYLKKDSRAKITMSLERPIDENGTMMRDLIPSNDEPLHRRISKNLTIDKIRNNGFSKNEKRVFSLLLEGYTVREIGQRMGVSHVMIVKYKNSLIEKWHEKYGRFVTNNQNELLKLISTKI